MGEGPTNGLNPCVDRYSANAVLIILFLRSFACYFWSIESVRSQIRIYESHPLEKSQLRCFFADTKKTRTCILCPQASRSLASLPLVKVRPLHQEEAIRTLYFFSDAISNDSRRRQRCQTSTLPVFPDGLCWVPSVPARRISVWWITTLSEWPSGNPISAKCFMAYLKMKIDVDICLRNL